jgi:thiol-disulfide isomerase/thioredoxin
MVLTPSTMAPLATIVPEFELPDTDGQLVSPEAFRGQPLLVAFISNHCPFVVHLKEALATFAHDYAGRIGIIAIASNNIETHPADGPEKMAEDKATFGYPFPYVFDETQNVAKDFGAACTPDFFLYDAELALAYRGQFDGSRPGNDVPITGEDLRAAVDALLDGQAPPDEQIPSVGCNIKWKPGNAPAWFG